MRRARHGMLSLGTLQRWQRENMSVKFLQCAWTRSAWPVLCMCYQACCHQAARAMGPGNRQSATAPA